MSAATPVRRLPRAERRTQIARAAAAAFMHGGFDGTAMDDVAREAGVTRLIVYRIFESKHELYRAVLEMVIDDVVASFADRPRPGRARSRTARSGAGHHEPPMAAVLLGVARRHPDGFRLLWRHAAHEPAFRESAAMFRWAVTDYAIALLEPEIGDLVLRRWAAESVVSNLYESICLWLDDGDPDRDDELVALLTEGIRAMVTRWVEVARASG